MKEYNSRVFQGPPGPPGPPGPAGYSRWFGSHGNATDLLEYIKCEQLYYGATNHKNNKTAEVLVDTAPHLISYLPAHDLLRDIVRNHNERVTQGPPGLPGPPGPPGYSRLFGSHANATEIVEFIKSKGAFTI